MKFVIAQVNLFTNTVEFHQVNADSKIDAYHKQFPETKDMQDQERIEQRFYDGDITIGIHEVTE